jgi:hypothetical protein
MNRAISFFIIGMFLINAIGVIASSTQPDFTIQSEHIIFSDPIIQEKEYIKITLKEANSYLIEENKPLLPMYTTTYYFPSNTEIINVKCTVQSIKKIDISKPLEPSPRPISVGIQSKPQDVISTYTLTEIYPNTWYSYDVGSGIIGDQRKKIVTIDILPVKYDPIRSQISWAESFDIEILYETHEEQIAQTNQYDLLILTPAMFLNELQPLADHKNGRGISTNIVTLEDISSGQYFPTEGRDEIEEIKYFIKNAIDNWLVTNVLIVGGADEFPARETHVLVGNDDDEIFVSDLYYADVYDEQNNFSSWDSTENDIFAEYDWEGNTDEIDFYPDVKIGRLACIDNEQVTTAVNKIITYETGEAYAQNWFNTIVVIGGDTVPGENSETDEGERVNQFILDRMQGFIPDKIWDSNGRLSGFSPTGLTNINDGINNGCGFLDFSGHGAPPVWTTFPHNGERQTLPTPTGRYTNTIIMEGLTNGDMLPIVFNGGCSLGKYTDNDNCNAWAFVANPNGGGIASFGATGLGYVYVGEYVTEGLVEGLNIDIIEAYRDGAKTLGEMHANGLAIYMHSRINGGDYKTLMEWHAFGDPTLQIRGESTPPEKPSRPTGSASGKTGETYEYTSSSTDPDGDDLYYLFNWDDDTFSEWIGPYAGGEEVTASHSWLEQGDYQIKVKSKDIHGVQSEWSDPLAISMPKNIGIHYSWYWFIQFIMERFPFL